VKISEIEDKSIESKEGQEAFTGFLTETSVTGVEYHGACFVLTGKDGRTLTFWYGDRDYPTTIEIEGSSDDQEQ
jgi:hypothetical protein